ncbi:MAG: glycosyltransferase family 2 protein [Chloroflexota bacterium]
MIVQIFWVFITLIIYTYAGYPLLVAFFARTQPKPRFKTADLPKITLLISAYNEEEVIAKKIENSLSLDYPRDKFQLLITADGSDDRTVAIVQSYADQGVELTYDPPRRGKMAAINRAIPLTTGDIIVFSDANNAYSSNALRELAAPFTDPTVAAVSGYKSIVSGDSSLGESEGLYWKYESFIKEQEARLGCCTGVCGEMLAIRRDLYEPPPDKIINDDFYMAMRLIKRGYRVAYAKDAKSSERISLSAKDEMARRARIVSGRYQAMSIAHTLLPWNKPVLVWQIVSHKFFRPLVPLAMIGALTTSLLGAWRPSWMPSRVLRNFKRPFAATLVLLQIIFYSLAWVGQNLRPRGILGMMLYLPTFMVNSNTAALVGLYRFLTGKQSTLWKRVARRADSFDRVE